MSRYFALLLFAITPFAKATLLLDPSGGASVGLTGNAGAVTRNLGGTFDLYGENITKINVGDQGFLGTGDVGGFFVDRTLSELANATATDPMHTDSVIAGFYDSLTFASGSSITDQSVGDKFYAVTYQSMYGFDELQTGFSTDFQIILFMGDVSMRGFDFHAGDIAISYGNLNSHIQGNSFDVGVAASDGRFTAAPPSTDGQFSKFDSLPTGSQFLLFSPNDGNYDVSVESIAPEPASLALAGLGLAGVALVKRRKKNL